MKRYEAYKAVQPLWNMTFPKHWEVFPLYSIAKEKSICNCTELELLSVYLDAGVVPFSKRTEKRTNATSKDLSKYQRVDPGDFVLNNQQAWRGSVGVSKHTGITSPAYVRTYNFLSAILPYGSVQWEKLSIFLNLLVPKLPKPDGEDYTEGLLEDVDLESYRAEAQQTMRIQLENENGKIDPIPVSTSVGIDVPELDTLTNILKEFHDIFGNIEWTDEDKIKKQINDIIESVRRDEKYNNAMQFSDKQNARDESDRAAHEAVMNSMQSGLELFREVQNNPSFRKWLFDSAFNSTYQANHNQTSL